MVDHPQGSVSARTAVALEYASLRHVNHCPTGMYVVPSTENLLIWDAVFFVHQGYYGDAIFKFRLKFPENYPEQPPEVYFVTDVFHPLVGQNGLLNLSVRFKPWRPKEHHVFDVLHWIKAAFKKHALDQIKEGDCLNKEAFRYHDSTQSFAALATQSALLSQSESALFDRDHPSMTGTAHEGIVFHKMKKNDLAKERAQLDLQEWSDPVQK
ncbi:ubiquitin-conjugating enzyme/RWD-like protein [Crucibulum laeve]|uniref:Ubiquitin-conjugating enzyme/RWD-like protein n=1 Tax=Crucibulum laeve TaxID=68775 RepID=A0A5C3MDZ4_9AGAR|nr:ubiquitin-conjugating enzyme/RWD-like protein [Crucibulum laeve]